jgi:hypothetical protein
MDIIETGDPASFTAYLQQYENTICGRHPIGVLLQVSTVPPLCVLYVYVDLVIQPVLLDVKRVWNLFSLRLMSEAGRPSRVTIQK